MDRIGESGRQKTVVGIAGILKSGVREGSSACQCQRRELFGGCSRSLARSLIHSLTHAFSVCVSLSSQSMGGWMLRSRNSMLCCSREWTRGRVWIDAAGGNRMEYGVKARRPGSLESRWHAGPPQRLSLSKSLAEFHGARQHGLGEPATRLARPQGRCLVLLRLRLATIHGDGRGIGRLVEGGSHQDIPYWWGWQLFDGGQQWWQ